MSVHITTIRVRYGETDQMGVAHHAACVNWLESGRVGLCRSLGVPYREVEQAGFNMAVAEMTIRYHQPALFDQEIHVETRAAKVTRRFLQFDYRMSNSLDETLITATTKHVVVDRELTRASLPDRILEPLRHGMSAHA